jgi:hypothetical protein
MENVLNQNKLEHLLLTNWADIIDRTQMLRLVLTHAQNSDYRLLEQSKIPPRQVKLTITKFSLVESNKFEVWAEFSVPKNEGVVVGTHVLSLSLSGEMNLKESYGTHFVPESS